MLDNPDDLTNGSEPAASGCMGSICFTAGFKNIWQKSPSGEWVKIVGDNNV